MHRFIFTIALTALFTLAQCIPTNSGHQNISTNHSTPNRMLRCYPQTYTYENQGSEGSPWVADCQQMIANIQGSGSWKVNPLTQRTLTTYKTCNFGATDADWGQGIVVGNQDIIYIVTESINRFAFDSRDGGGKKVGAKGTFQCSPTARWHIDNTWGLY
ncbi:putative necrosis-inducing factor-domain-containing protein [Cladorrhinum sp. PSN259]|nr:putative necrosis-inducing factor-domain-containing protein [Cladorrhinum sp. PSN259]